ncbi:MAG: sodium:proton antiporter [Pseudomonadota bacterium]|nr:sodium:proton antiporter [Pseudomonadota bacterium]
MESPALLILAVAILAYGLVSRHLHRISLTAPIVFTALGVLIGSAALDLFDVDIASHQIELLAELTLILVLFADAAGIDLRLLHADQAVPARMLAIGLPLAVLLGTGAALLILPGLGLWQAALLATMLAPTDAALARSVLVDDRLPTRVKQTLNAESGLNDGLALPLVFLFLALAGTSAHAGADNPLIRWTGFFTAQAGLGILVGVAAGGISGRLVERAVKAGEMDKVFERLSAVALALLAYVGASLIGGNGFIAAFTGGMAFGRFTRRARKPVISFGETEGQLLALLTFVVFGAVMLPQTLGALDWRMPLFALVSLFGVRPLAIWLSLAGTGLLTSTKLFFGWFGPRGLASIVFALIVESQLGGDPAAPLVATVTLTVGLSVVLHGFSAGPLAALYARRLEARSDKDALMEFAQVEHGSNLKRSRF